MSRAYLRFGAVGSVARWAWKGYQQLRSEDTGTPEDVIAKTLWVIRYGVSPPRPGSAEAYRHESVDPLEIQSLEELCNWVVWVEMGVVPADGRLFTESQQVIQDELARLRSR
jgi:hypothetical protein